MQFLGVAWKMWSSLKPAPNSAQPPTWSPDPPPKPWTAPSPDRPLTIAAAGCGEQKLYGLMFGMISRLLLQMLLEQHHFSFFFLHLLRESLLLRHSNIISYYSNKNKLIKKKKKTRPNAASSSCFTPGSQRTQKHCTMKTPHQSSSVWKSLSHAKQWWYLHQDPSLQRFWRRQPTQQVSLDTGQVQFVSKDLS